MLVSRGIPYRRIEDILEKCFKPVIAYELEANFDESCAVIKKVYDTSMISLFIGNHKIVLIPELIYSHCRHIKGAEAILKDNTVIGVDRKSTELLISRLSKELDTMIEIAKYDSEKFNNMHCYIIIDGKDVYTTIPYKIMHLLEDSYQVTLDSGAVLEWSGRELPDLYYNQDGLYSKTKKKGFIHIGEDFL